MEANEGRRGFGFKSRKILLRSPDFPSTNYQDNKTLHEQGDIKHTVFSRLTKVLRSLLRTLDELDGGTHGSEQIGIFPNRCFYPHDAVEFSSLGRG